MSFFDSDDYKSLIADLLASMPRQGYGQFRRLADHLRVNPVVVSQVFRGPRHLTPEQALGTADFFGFSDPQAAYFLLLVDRARAGTPRLRQHLDTRILRARERSRELRDRVPEPAAITEEAKALFYSNWYYSAVRLLSSIDGFQTVEAIAEELGLSRQKVRRAADFLVRVGLCRREKGQLRMGSPFTHLDEKSPLITRHHANWRLRGLAAMDSADSTEFFLTAPLVIGERDMPWVRAELVSLVERIMKRIGPSPCERVACLNIDWFDFRPRNGS